MLSALCVREYLLIFAGLNLSNTCCVYQKYELLTLRSNSNLADSLNTLTQSGTGLAHLKLGHELCKDAEKGLCVGGFAVLSEVGGHLGELLHRSGLQRLQRLDRRVAVLQKAL